MNFLKKLFSSGQSSGNALSVYVRPKMCKQIIQLEIDLANQLSTNDNEDGYWVRKLANSPRCPFEAEVMLYFDKGKKLINREVNNGEFVDEQAYLDFLESSQKKAE